MPATLEAVAKDALVLTRDERLLLARHLLVSVEPEPAQDVDEAWEEEIGHRIERFDAGFSQTIPASEVFARLAAIAPRQ